MLFRSVEKPANTSEFVENIFTKLIQIQNKAIIISEKKIEKTETEFEFEQPFLKEFYENIKSKLASSNFQISKIEHKSYHEIYEFTKGGYIATYKFHYNGRKIFGKCEIIQNRTNGLIDEINPLLKLQD